ncbi:MAG: CbiX/SirB N-terminal domain-containing protein [Anaerolineales bacterium]
MPTLIVLAMHGVPPNDFPREELGEYFRLHAAMEAAHHGAEHVHNGNGRPGLSPAELESYQALDLRIRNWPRNELNDPFYAGSLSLAKALGKQNHHPVLVGFNEFCAPDLKEAFRQAVNAGARRVVIITPMMTSGDAPAELDIPAAVNAAREDFPQIEFIYAWPFGRNEVAGFLSAQVECFLAGKLEPAGWR